MKMVRIIGKEKQERDVPEDQVEDMKCSGWVEAVSETEKPKAAKPAM